MAPDAAPPTKKAATIAPHRAIVGGPALRAKSLKFMMRRSPPTASTSGKTSLPADPYAIAADANPAKTALALVSGGVGGSRRANAVAWPALHVPNAAAARVGGTRIASGSIAPRAWVCGPLRERRGETRETRRHPPSLSLRGARGPAFVALGFAMRSSAGRVLDDKRLAEDFRARQHGGPHPLATSIGDVRPGSPRGGSPHPPPPAEDAGSRRRVIVHFDADCFYCQVEELRDPRLAERPVAVTQKYLIVTANYRARAAGLEKLMATSEARRLCPEVALISGEDLTPYRRCAKRVRRLLARFGTCEKLGLDECWVDVTAEVDRRVRAAGPGADPPLVGHRHVAARLVSSSNPHRPMDVRAKPDATTRVGTGVDVDADVDVDVDVDAVASDERRLRVGAAIAAEAREALRLELGLRCSAGIAHNKMCAKLASGLHKPDDQTVLPRVETASTVAPLPLRALPGVGWATERALSQRGLRVAADARAATRETLCAWLGARVGAKTHDAAWGVDRDPVREKPPPAAVTCEDSFRACSSSDAVARVLAVLAPDLVSRVDEEHEDELERNHPRRVGRSPTTLTVKWRLAAGYRASTREKRTRTSASVGMPAIAADPNADVAARAEAIAAAAIAVLRRELPPGFNLTCLNVGASGFRPSTTGAPGGFGTVDVGDGAPVEVEGGAVAATTRRRDYDATSARAPKVAKTVERAARERERGVGGRGGERIGAPEEPRGACENVRGTRAAGGCDESDQDEEDDGAKFFADLADTAAATTRGVSVSRRGAEGRSIKAFFTKNA